MRSCATRQPHAAAVAAAGPGGLALRAGLARGLARRRERVHEAVAGLAVAAGRADVGRRRAEEALDLVPRQRRVHRAHQRGGPRDVGRGHRGARVLGVAAARDAREDRHAGAGEVGLQHRARRGALAVAVRPLHRAAAGEGGDAAVAVDRAHGERLGIAARAADGAGARAGVARGEGGDDPERPPPLQVGTEPGVVGVGRLSPRVADDLGEVGAGGVPVGIGHPLGRGDDVAARPGAVAGDRLGDQELRARRHADVRAGQGAGGVRPVAVVVVGRRPARDHVAPVGDLPGERRMPAVGAGVDRADADRAAGGAELAPGLRGPHGVKAPAPGAGLVQAGCRRRPDDRDGGVEVHLRDRRVGGDQAHLEGHGAHGDRVDEPVGPHVAREPQAGQQAGLGEVRGPAQGAEDLGRVGAAGRIGLGLRGWR